MILHKTVLGCLRFGFCLQECWACIHDFAFKCVEYLGRVITFFWSFGCHPLYLIWSLAKYKEKGGGFSCTYQFLFNCISELHSFSLQILYDSRQTINFYLSFSVSSSCKMSDSFISCQLLCRKIFAKVHGSRFELFILLVKYGHFERLPFSFKWTSREIQLLVGSSSESLTK